MNSELMLSAAAEYSHCFHRYVEYVNSYKLKNTRRFSILVYVDLVEILSPRGQAYDTLYVYRLRLKLKYWTLTAPTFWLKATAACAGNKDKGDDLLKSVSNILVQINEQRPQDN